MTTVAEYVIDRLAELGIDCAFGVPGDFSFPFDDAIDANDRVQWVVCANELNAAYAADGYARIKGAAILSTTYGVGELSALNGVMGSKAHRLPVFHIVGAPSTRVQRQGLLTHHTLGDGVFNNFAGLSAAATCVVANLTPENTIAEMERVIKEAFHHSAPAYITVPMDLGLMPVIGQPPEHLVTRASCQQEISVQGELDAAVTCILEKLACAETAVALPTAFLATRDLQGLCESFLSKVDMPFATTPMDKGVLPESHDNYLGLYAGAGSVPEALKSWVEHADVVLDIGGVVFLDFNTTLWTSTIDEDRIITIGDHYVRVGKRIFTGISMGDVLRELNAKAVPHRFKKPTLGYPEHALVGDPEAPVTSDAFYPRLQRLLKPGDVLVGETGTCLLHLNKLRLPAGVGFQNQTLWGSIGWATPAALGTSLANPSGRTVLVTGDGAHQLTANEIGTMGRYGVKPIIFVLNNGIYGVEDVLSELGHVYDDLAAWKFHLLPQAMGCKHWFTAKASTIGALDAAMKQAESFDGACYIEVMIPASESQPLPEQVRQSLYQTQTPV